MAGLGAFAQRFLGGFGVHTRSEGKQTFDEARALTAGGRRLGMGAHLRQGGELFVLDGGDDRALGDAVAAADLGIVGHGREVRSCGFAA